MRNNPGLLILSILLLLGCEKKASSIQSELADRDSNNSPVQSETVPSKPAQAETGKPWHTFQTVYTYVDKEEELEQRLGVNWITEDSIEFRLQEKNRVCDSDLSGSAVNRYPGMDPEMDEDEEEAYAVAEYWSENKAYELAVRIALDRSKAQFWYKDKVNPKDECQFGPVAILKPAKMQSSQ